jgi:hypothetical protein
VLWQDFFAWRTAQAEKAFNERILSPMESRWQRYQDYKKSLGDQRSTEHEGKPELCPFCGKASIVPILYGLPSPEGREAAKRGKFVLGGCCLSFDNPNWYCRDCDNYFDWRTAFHPDDWSLTLEAGPPKQDS